MQTLYIKNMVCPRCVMAVERLLTDMGLHVVRVELGEAVIDDVLTPARKAEVGGALRGLGFELMEDNQSVTVESIRRNVLAWVRMRGDRPLLSDCLQRQLHKDYSALSKLFSEACGITIERYCIMQRVEYVKELLCYGQSNIKEIAYQLGYSSPAHLSSQFKQEVGLSPAQFKRDHSLIKRRPVDRL